METTRQGLKAIGRMPFMQCTEMINSATSWGLQPNLAMEDARFLFESTDIAMASVQSKLGFLSHPVNHHVQTAEMVDHSLAGADFGALHAHGR